MAEKLEVVSKVHPVLWNLVLVRSGRPALSLPDATETPVPEEEDLEMLDADGHAQAEESEQSGDKTGKVAEENPENAEEKEEEGERETEENNLEKQEQEMTAAEVKEWEEFEAAACMEQEQEEEEEVEEERAEEMEESPREITEAGATDSPILSPPRKVLRTADEEEENETQWPIGDAPQFEAD